MDIRGDIMQCVCSELFVFIDADALDGYYISQ